MMTMLKENISTLGWRNHAPLMFYSNAHRQARSWSASDLQYLAVYGENLGYLPYQRNKQIEQKQCTMFQVVVPNPNSHGEQSVGFGATGNNHFLMLKSSCCTSVGWRSADVTLGTLPHVPPQRQRPGFPHGFTTTAPGFLRWRTGNVPLGHRALVAGAQLRRARGAIMDSLCECTVVRSTHTHTHTPRKNTIVKYTKQILTMSCGWLRMGAVWTWHNFTSPKDCVIPREMIGTQVLAFQGVHNLSRPTDGGPTT